ncbi:MAG TPA: hypothetical protein VIR58_03450 [Acidimicrobiales bacterium]
MPATVEPPGDEDHETEPDDRDRRELPDRGERDATEETSRERGAAAANDCGDRRNRGEIPVTHR